MNQKKMIRLIHTHIARYPAMELDDVYKLLYQSVMGPAHILQNKELAYSYLKREFESHDDNYETKLYVDISLEHDLVRLNIPLFRKEGSLDALFDMMLETQIKARPDEAKLKCYWVKLGSLIEDNYFEQFTPNQWNKLNKILHENDFPHLSHSVTYKNLYKPSYRIVLRELV